MSAPQKSLLDADQCIQGAYDESAGAFRIETSPDTGGMTEVSISDADDSVKIGNGNGQYLSVNSNGSINVNVVSNNSTAQTSYTNVIQYQEITNVAMGATETLMSYTVPSTGSFYLTQINFSGDSISEFDLQINSSTIEKQRLYYYQMNSLFDYRENVIPGYNLSSGTTIGVVVTNYSQQGVGSFNATLQGIIVQ